MVQIVVSWCEWVSAQKRLIVTCVLKKCRVTANNNAMRPSNTFKAQIIRMEK